MKPLISKEIHLQHRIGINTASIEVGRAKVSRLVMNLMIDSPKTVAVVQSTSSMAWQNIKSFLLGIFPSNLLGVFVENNVLGVIFIALLTGITAGKKSVTTASSGGLKIALKGLNT